MPSERVKVWACLGRGRYSDEYRITSIAVTLDRDGYPSGVENGNCCWLFPNKTDADALGFGDLKPGEIRTGWLTWDEKKGSKK